MALEKLRCPYCRKEGHRTFSINPSSTNETIHWTNCDDKDCKKKFWYKTNGKVGKKEEK